MINRAAFCWVIACALPLTAAWAAADLPRLRVEDGKIVSADGPAPFLHGVNLGNWLLLEPGALGGAFGQFPDQYTLFSVLRDRFGEAERWRLIELYRDS